jgi:urease accessory protein
MKPILALALIGLPAVALAHPGHHHVDWSAGFLHPLTGLDHLLALAATGFWLSQTQARKKPGLIAAFITLLAVFIAVGAQFTDLSLEFGITASLVVLGGLIACAAGGPIIARVAVVALTAMIHGFVHGTELPAGESILPFVGGLLISSAAVVLAASWLGQYAQPFAKGAIARIAGVLLLLFGVATAF